MKFSLSLLSLLIVLMLLTSCNKEDNRALAYQKLFVLFSPGGLGDMGYNDQILRGIQTARKDREDVISYFYTPKSVEEADTIFKEWLFSSEEDMPSLFVLASSDYENMAATYLKGSFPQRANRNILLFESNNLQNLPLCSFQISMYGASFLAGKTAAACSGKSPLVVLGNDTDIPTGYAVDGFLDGYANHDTTRVIALAHDWSGYASEALAYRRMTEWATQYGFIFPVAGGSNGGIYRYLREFPGEVFTAGMDIDQSALCSKITGSVVKHIDVLIHSYVTQWLDSKTMPRQTLYGLESGYVDWELAPDYKETYQSIVDKNRSTAIQKERQYYEAK